MSSRVPVVLYDTSILILMFRENVKVFQNVKDIVGLHIPTITELTLKELEKMLKFREIKTRNAARLALEFVKKYMSICKCSSDICDDCIFEMCIEKNVDYVVTCDLELRKRILENTSCKVLYYLASKNRIVLD